MGMTENKGCADNCERAAVISTCLRRSSYFFPPSGKEVLLTPSERMFDPRPWFSDKSNSHASVQPLPEKE
jgi:hypothetical protein